MKKTTLILVGVALAFSAALAQAPGRLNRNGGLLNRNRQGRNNQAAAPAAPQQTPEDLADGSSLNFNQTAIDLVFETYGRMVGKTVLKDPQCPAATITLKSEKGQKLSQEEQIEAIEIILEMNGVHMEPYGEKFVRALPRKDVRKEGIPLIMDPDARLKESGKVVSMMIPFKNIGTEEAQKVLEGFKSASGILIVIERTNSILVTDTEQNINRMLEISRTIDVASPVLENVFVRQIKNANATEIKTALEAIVQESQKELEKSKGANSNVASPNQNRPMGGLLGGLRRPGQNNNQQQAPANNASLVMTVSDADRGMIRGKVLILADERSNKLIIVTQKANMDFFDKVIEQLDVETTPDTVVKVYRLKYADAEDVSDMINDLIGNSTSSKSSSKNSQNQNAKKGSGGNITRNNTPVQKKPANQRTGETQAGELSKDNTTVLADKRINGLVVMTMKELVPTIEQIIESMDIKLSQVLIETTIIEVTLGDGIETGMDWLQKGRQSATKTQNLVSENGLNMYRYYKTDDSGNRTYQTHEDWGESFTLGETTWTRVGDALTESVGYVNRSGLLNNYGGATSVGLAGGAEGGLSALNAAGAATNVLGKAFSFIFDSDELGLQGILQASKTDSHSKYIASPIVMTLDNKEATVEATSSRQFLTGWQAVSSSYAGSGLPSPTYTAKDIGIKLKITPKINPNGTVMLEVEEEYSQVSGSQTMLTPVGQAYKDTTIDVPVTRTMSSDVLMENGQTVVFGGLTEKLTSNEETGIPILKDIPYIGKWLFGKVSEKEDRVELLVFMTPYVLDDAQSAQAEALRRKKTMADPRPWDDDGWSASNLADPVSKKEQMRRIKEEWKKQDEERKTRIAIETEKVKRAKKLKELTKEERDLWLKMHKEELEEEAQEELEKKMLDKDSQEELKKLAADIRAKKLKSAEKELKKAEEETAADNERTKMDAAKKSEKAETDDDEAEKPEAENAEPKKPEVEAEKVEGEPKKVEAETAEGEPKQAEAEKVEAN